MIKYLYKTNYGELKNVKRIMSLFIAALLMTQINTYVFAEEYVWQTVNEFDFAENAESLGTVGDTSKNTADKCDSEACIKNSGERNPENGIVINNLIPKVKNIGESYRIRAEIYLGTLIGGEYKGKGEIRLGLNEDGAEIKSVPLRTWTAVDFTYTVTQENVNCNTFFIDRGGKDGKLKYPRLIYIKSAEIAKSCSKAEAEEIAATLKNSYESFSFDGFEDTGENIGMQEVRDGVTYVTHHGNSALKSYNRENLFDSSTKIIPPEGYSYLDAWTNDNDGAYVFDNLLPNFTKEDIGRKIKISMYVYVKQMYSGSGHDVGFSVCISNREETEKESVKGYGEAFQWRKIEGEFEITEKNLNYNKIMLMFDNGSECPMWTRVDAVSVSVTKSTERKNNNIKLTVDGTEKKTAHPLKIDGDRLMLPAADLFDAIGGGYEMSEDGRSIKATYNNLTADMGADSDIINRSGYKMFGQERARMIDGILYIPLNTLTVAFKGKAVWDGITQTLSVDTSIDEIRRPIPKSTLTDNKDLYDIHYDEQEKVEKIPWDEVPEGDVILDRDALFKGYLQGGGTYGNMETVAVEGQPFDKALKIECTTVPAEVYHFQLELPDIKKEPKVGDVVVVELYMKTDSVRHEDANGITRIAVMTHDYSRMTNEEVMVSKDKKDNGGWEYIRVAGCITHEDATRTTLEFGYRRQVMEIGGIKVRNIGNKIPVEKLDTQNYKLDAINAIYDKDAQWRKDAIARIEKYRKGDINVVVADKNGKPITDADVDISMYEHEFEWGNAFTYNELYQEPVNSKHQQLMASLFNTGVAVGSNKRYGYEIEGRFNARRKKDALAKLGIKNFRGHAVYFDFQNEDLAANYKDEKKMRENLWTYFDAVYNDYGDYTDWDIMNEVISWAPLRKLYGAQLYKEWFAYARERLPEGAILNYNETNFGEDFYKLLKEMNEIGVDYNSVGFQGHFRFQKVENLYDMFKPVIEYGKRMKITEFDMNEEDPELAAGFIRDFLILCFSIPNFDTFISWGFRDIGHWLNNGPYYYDDDHIKPGGEQYIDLVYNKWWTEESGKTGNDGIYKTRGFYGDYDITVKKGGATVKTTAKVSKNNKDNTIVVTFK